MADTCSPKVLTMEWSSEASTAEDCDLVSFTSEGFESNFDDNESAVLADSLKEENNCNHRETGGCACDDSNRLRRDSTPSCIGSVDADELADTLFASEISLRTKNTFLEVKLIPCDTWDRVRRGSEPSPTAKLEADECSGPVLWTSEDFEPHFEANESTAQGDSLEEESNYNNSETGAFPLNFSVRTKNTFLDFTYAADDDSANTRRLSAPACLLLTSEDLVLPSNADESLRMSTESFEEESWQAETEDHMSTSRKPPSKAKRDRERGRQRLRSKKLLTRLCEQIDEDPEGFDMALIKWPQSVIDKYVVQALEAHKAKALQELASR